MKIKTKKLVNGKIIKLESGGEIRELIIKEDIMHLESEKINICFRGFNSSGIVEFSRKEAENILEDLSSKLNLIKKAKIIRG